MSKKISEESRIVNYFQSASAESMAITFGIVKDIVKKRLAEGESVKALDQTLGKHPKKRRARKVNSGSGAATSFPGPGAGEITNVV